MRKFEELSLWEKTKAIVWTKMQELCYIIHYISDHKKISTYFGELGDKVTEWHYKLFSETKIETVVACVRCLDPNTAIRIAKKELLPLCQRNVKMQMTILRKYKNKKFTPAMQDLLIVSLMLSILTDGSQADCAEIITDIIRKEKKA